MTTPLLPENNAEAKTAEVSLTQVTADGAAWILITTLVTRVLSIVSQLILARLLFPAELGLVALAQFVVGIVSFLGSLSLTQFLVARQRKIALYADAAFWLTLLIGVVGALFLATSGPIAAKLYHQPRLIGLLLFCAATFPIAAVLVVPLVMAQIELRFKLMAVVFSAAMFSQVVASIVAARLGAGAYSIFIGATAATLTRLILICWKMKIRFRFRPRYRFRVERILLASTSSWVVAVGALNNVISQGDYATMGLFFDEINIGYYFFAFNLAQQAVVLLGSSLGSVLYPTISRLAGAPERQTSAVMRAIKLLTLVGGPGGLLVVFLMPPIVHAFGSKYLPAIPIAQVMAAGAVGVLVSAPAAALMTAQERFKLYFFFTLTQTALFLSFVLLGCLTGQVLGVAAAVSIYFWIGGPLSLVLALDGYRVKARTLRSVAVAIGSPLAWSLPATLAALLVYMALPSDGSFRQDFIRSVASAGIFSVVVIPTLWLTMRTDCETLLDIAQGVLRRLSFIPRRAPSMA